MWGPKGATFAKSVLLYTLSLASSGIKCPMPSRFTVQKNQTTNSKVLGLPSRKCATSSRVIRSEWY